MAARGDFEQDLARLASELKRLEAEYTMFFSGQSPRPPVETRSRVDAMVKRIDRAAVQNYGDRFRFTTIQSRYMSLVDLWTRGMRAREEGRPGPFGRAGSGSGPRSERPADRTLHVTTLRDPAQEAGRLRELYASLAEAKREVGEEVPSFHRFAELVANQVTKLNHHGESAVAFRVAVKDGRVAFTARALADVTGERAKPEERKG